MQPGKGKVFGSAEHQIRARGFVASPPVHARLLKCGSHRWQNQRGRVTRKCGPLFLWIECTVFPPKNRERKIIPLPLPNINHHGRCIKLNNRNHYTCAVAGLPGYSSKMTSAAFTPKLATVLSEGYSAAHFRSDAVAGLTVAIVALPLSMAIAIASHATPATGLYTAIVGGFFISALGGSRYQIGGPAGAFIVLVASVIDRFGFDALLLATMMAGVIMLVAGIFRVGGVVRLVPHPVIVGFSSGIAIIIFASQLKEMFGISLNGAEPAVLMAKLQSLWRAGATFNPHALLLAVFSVGLIIVARILRPRWPGFLFSVVVCSAIAAVSGLDVATIGTRFGGIPHDLPVPHLPRISTDLALALFPSALSIAVLGSIESLLSAVVADNMKGRRHRSNAELVAQGIANIVVPVFGGITATGTIARTATNVRAGAHGPVSGILHSVFLLLFMLVAAPLASYIPLAALAGILIVVSWNMFETTEFARLLKRWPTALVLLATLLITIFADLLTGIVAGTVLSMMLSFFARSSDTSET
jgi:sulfate permease, SulP family